MTEQIDNLLIPRVMVTNPWPESTYESGVILTALDNGKMPLRIRGHYYEAAELCARYPGNFRLLEWWEVCDDSSAPGYVKEPSTGAVYKVDWFDWSGAYFKPENDLPRYLHQTLPATSAQYLEYLNQQSK